MISYLCASCHGRSFYPVTCRLPTTLRHLAQAVGEGGSLMIARAASVSGGHRCGQWWAAAVACARLLYFFPVWNTCLLDVPEAKGGWMMMDDDQFFFKKNKLYKMN